MFGSLGWGVEASGGPSFWGFQCQGALYQTGHERLHEIGAQCRP